MCKGRVPVRSTRRTITLLILVASAAVSATFYDDCRWPADFNNIIGEQQCHLLAPVAAAPWPRCEHQYTVTVIVLVIYSINTVCDHATFRRVYLFSPRGMPGPPDVCSANVLFFIFFHIFVVNFSPCNIRIYWTDFHQIFTRMAGIWSYIIDRTLFSRSLKGRRHGNHFWGKIAYFIRRTGVPKYCKITIQI